MTRSPQPLVGLLPAAGLGLRMQPLKYPKELLALPHVTPDGTVEPLPVCDFALSQLANAGVERMVVVVAPSKWELVRVLGDSWHGIPLAYAVQPVPKGLPNVVACAAPWLGDANVVMAMPDTVVWPANALLSVEQLRLAKQADLALGVFPTSESGRLGPVELDPDGNVTAIHDKPGHHRFGNTWGVLAWSSAFTLSCCQWQAQHAGDELVLGHAMEAARQAGMKVVAQRFGEEAGFEDVGTPKGLAHALSQGSRFV